MNAPFALTRAPIGHDAPKHSVAWSNYAAACIAAREVAIEARYSEAHRQSLDAWRNGERAWPWPDATPEQIAKADAEAMGLVHAMEAIEAADCDLQRECGR